ncbi:hypothetical protein WG66_010436, partial [Moniliophthora roreri]
MSPQIHLYLALVCQQCGLQRFPVRGNSYRIPCGNWTRGLHFTPGRHKLHQLSFVTGCRVWDHEFPQIWAWDAVHAVRLQYQGF